jgi:hypothetical protein
VQTDERCGPQDTKDDHEQRQTNDVGVVLELARRVHASEQTKLFGCWPQPTGRQVIRSTASWESASEQTKLNGCRPQESANQALKSVSKVVGASDRQVANQAIVFAM